MGKRLAPQRLSNRTCISRINPMSGHVCPAKIAFPYRKNITKFNQQFPQLFSSLGCHFLGEIGQQHLTRGRLTNRLLTLITGLPTLNFDRVQPSQQLVLNQPYRILGQVYYTDLGRSGVIAYYDPCEMDPRADFLGIRHPGRRYRRQIPIQGLYRDVELTLRQDYNLLSYNYPTAPPFSITSYQGNTFPTNEQGPGPKT